MRDRGVSKADVALVIHSPESRNVRIDGRTEAKRPTRQGDYVKVIYIEDIYIEDSKPISRIRVITVYVVKARKRSTRKPSKRTRK